MPHGTPGVDVLRVLDARTGEVLGSGWLLTGSDVVVTCAHVVATSTGRQGDVVLGARGGARACELVGMRPPDDLAVLRVGPRTASGPPAVREPAHGEPVVVRLASGDVPSRVLARLEPGTVRCRGLVEQLAPMLHLVEGRWGHGHSGAPVLAADGALVGMLVAASADPRAGVVVGGPTVADGVRGVLAGAGALAVTGGPARG